MNKAGPGLYIGRVLSFDAATKDIYALVPQVQADVPILCQAFINFIKDLKWIKHPGVDRRVLIFYDGSELDTKPYWMLGTAGVSYGNRVEITDDIFSDNIETDTLTVNETLTANEITANVVTVLDELNVPPIVP